MSRFRVARHTAAHLGVAAVALLSAACATGGSVVRPSPFPTPGAPAAARPASTEIGTGVVAAALAERGRPYRLGGTDPAGFDCSGLVAYAFLTRSVVMPRTVAEQFKAGASIRLAEAQAGDLVFFATGSSSRPTHVGIVIDQTSFVHAPDQGGVVRVEHLDAPYWKQRFVGIRRVTD